MRLFSDAYRRYLTAEQRLKLMERGSLINRAELDDSPEQVARAWGKVFE
jgi:hypothetical protein